MFGNTSQAANMIQKCVADQGFHGGAETRAPANVMTFCLAGISSSSLARDNETLCKAGDVSSSTSVSDSSMPKEREAPTSGTTTEKVSDK